MDWAVAEPMLARGELPELARLLEEGVRVPLRSRRPTNSPALWTTMATGVQRWDHGVLDFVYLPEGGGRQLPVHAGTRTRPAFWEVLSVLGQRSVTVGWFVSWPPDPVAGALVSDRWNVAEPSEDGPPLTHPAGLAELDPAPEGLEGLGAELLDALVPVEGSPDPTLRPGGAVEDARRYVETDLARARMAVALASSMEARVVTCYLQAADATSHFLWKYREPEAGSYAAPRDPTAAPRLAGVVEASYRLADEVLGRLRRAVGPEASVVLVSDHGFGPFVEPDSILVRLDLLAERLGLLVRDAEGRPDPERSTLLPGEGTGIVEPLGARDRLLYVLAPDGGEPPVDRTAETLKSLRTVEGRALFEKVEVVEPAAAEGVDPPDLVVRVSREALADRRLVLPRGGFLDLGPPLLYRYDDVSGTHRMDAVLVVKAPGAPAGARWSEELRPEALHPLILALAGAPVPEDIAGRLPEGLWGGEDASPLARVRSYRPWIDRQTGTPEGAADEEFLERLRSLGYVND